jgi:hypothetical protein
MEQRTTRRLGPFRLYDKLGFDEKERNIGARRRRSDLTALRFEILRRYVQRLSGVVPRFTTWMIGLAFLPLLREVH